MSSVKDLIKGSISPKEIEVPITEKSSRGVYSVSITYNRNGKRLSITNALASRLELEGYVRIGLLPDKRYLILSKDSEELDEYEYSDTSSRPIIYDSGLVEGIVYGFGLESVYENRTSVSFSNVKFDDKNLAVVIKIPEVDEID